MYFRVGLCKEATKPEYLRVENVVRKAVYISQIF
jgi:hypothetical protein